MVLGFLWFLVQTYLIIGIMLTLFIFSLLAFVPGFFEEMRAGALKEHETDLTPFILVKVAFYIVFLYPFAIFLAIRKVNK